MSVSSVDAGLEDTQAYLERAFALWRKAQVVHESPSWQGKPEARAAVEQIAASHPEYESALVDALHDENSLMVAHALMALELMQSNSLQDLPKDLLERRSNITLVTGSYKYGMDLGGLARQIQKRTKERLAALAKPS